MNVVSAPSELPVRPLHSGRRREDGLLQERPEAQVLPDAVRLGLLHVSRAILRRQRDQAVPLSAAALLRRGAGGGPEQSLRGHQPSRTGGPAARRRRSLPLQAASGLAQTAGTEGILGFVEVVETKKREKGVHLAVSNQRHHHRG